MLIADVRRKYYLSVVTSAGRLSVGFTRFFSMLWLDDDRGVSATKGVNGCKTPGSVETQRAANRKRYSDAFSRGAIEATGFAAMLRFTR